MNVSLTPELEEFIAHEVQSGLYHTSSEVVREGLRLLKAQNELHRQRTQALHREIILGIQDLDAGRVIQGEQFDQELKELAQEYRQAAE